MPLQLENNRLFPGAPPEQTITGTQNGQIGILGRVFIDLGIALATIGATVLTGGTALPAIVPGLIGSATGLITNTAIDVGEGNTDALTLGLDIGLPFATEGLGTLINLGVKEVTLTAKFGARLLDKVGLDSVEFQSRLTIKNILVAAKDNSQILSKVTVTGFVPTAEDVAKYGANVGKSSAEAFAKNNKLLKDAVESIDRQIKTIENSFKSFTDLLDKVTGSARELIARLLPRLSKVLKQLKAYLKRFQKAVSELLNPINLALTKAKTATKAILKNIKADEADVKVRLRTIRQRYNIRKQSILQNALISKYNISRVESTWILGTSLVIIDAEDNGTIKDAHLIWWFIPEATKHDGSRGAVPEPMGKRPVAMKNINQSQYDLIMKEASKGRFYLDNVGNDKSSTGLFGGDSGINISDLSSNWISKLFKGAVSIIPGYNLLVDVGHSIKQFETLTSKIVSGELGTDYVKQLTNYKSHLHQFGSYLLPKQFNEAANLLYKNQHFDGSAILKSVEGRAQSVQSNLTKDGVVKKVQNY